MNKPNKETEAAARAAYEGWNKHKAHTTNVLSPRWQYLDKTIQRIWIEAAERAETWKGNP